jgi:LAO/AO transport system kinase
LDVEELHTKLEAGNVRALARSLSLVENRDPAARKLLARAFKPETLRGLIVVGVTGPPGVGKSTLVDGIASELRKRDPGRDVAVLAIDPSSPFTGGAVLGDRARMDSGSRDPSVFIRSMATRGHVGGLASAAFEALILLATSGKELVLLESVGAGQDEVEIAGAATVTVVVLAPGQGDDLQANKAGILEIADVLVVNKSDRDGAGMLAEELEAARDSETPLPKIVRTVASEGRGLGDLCDELQGLIAERKSDGDRVRRLLDVWLEDAVRRRARERISDSDWRRSLNRILAGEATPDDMAETLLGGVRSGNGAK